MQGLFGRSRELDVLERAVADVKAGQGVLLLLVGEPGIGKTRLADEACRRAEPLRAVWGRAWEAGGAPPYWPWIEILRQLVPGSDRGWLEATLGAEASLVAGVLPELRGHWPGLPPLPEGRLEHGRFALFDAIGRLLRACAEREPLLIVLDDLHVADDATLHLLEFVARGLRGARILMIGTHRDADPALSPERAQLLQSIAREGQRLLLARLEEPDVRELLESASKRPLEPQVIRDVLRITEGTPLFVSELAQTVLSGVAEGILLTATHVSLPNGLDAAIRSRLERLPTRSTLSRASVIGREFRVSTVRALLDEGDAELAGAQLRAALEAGFLRPASGEAGHYRFSHILVRECVYGDLPPGTRSMLHARLARHFVEVAAPPAEIAHHFKFAGPLESENVARFEHLAGQDALRIGAHEQAATHFRSALDASPGEVSERVEIGLALSEAYRRSGDRARANEASERAASHARTLGLVDLFARAVLQRGAEFTLGRTEPLLVSLLEEALALPLDPVVRPRVMARLAAALQPATDPDEPLDLARRAIVLAREAGDRRALAVVLRDARATYLPMDSIDERVALDVETLSLALEADDAYSALHALRRLVSDRFEQGDVAAANGHVDHYERVTDRLREPRHQWFPFAARAGIAILEGRFGDGDALLQEADRSRGPEQELAGLAFSFGQRLLFCLASRRDDQLRDLEADLGRALAATSEPMLAWVRAIAQLRKGEIELVRASFPGIRRGYHPRFAGQSLSAEIAIAVEDIPLMQTIYDALSTCTAPFPAQMTFDGSHSRALGQLAWALGQPARAREHFELALAENARIGAKPWTAVTAFEYGRRLLTTGDARDRERAHQLHEQALATARELGMPGLIRDLEALAKSEHHGRPPDPVPRLVCEGEYWTVTFAGEALRMRDSKGLKLVAHLLAHPGTQFHVLDLAGLISSGASAGSVVQSGLPSGPDAKARLAYEQALADLRSELEEAESHGDLGRREILRERLEALTEELLRGQALGGRQRETGGSVERARVNVQRRISDAVRKLAALSPALGQLLTRKIRTGTTCSFDG